MYVCLVCICGVTLAFCLESLSSLSSVHVVALGRPQKTIARTPRETTRPLLLLLAPNSVYKLYVHESVALQFANYFLPHKAYEQREAFRNPPHEVEWKITTIAPQIR